MTATVVTGRFPVSRPHPEGERSAVLKSGNVPGLASISVPLAFENGTVEAKLGTTAVEIFISAPGGSYVFFLDKGNARAFGHALVKLGEST